MLVIPALISLKPSVIEQVTPEMNDLIAIIIEKLRDQAEIVAKTAKKLLLELKKCYPSHFANNYIERVPSHEEKHIC